jgi:hypothetical protein
MRIEMAFIITSMVTQLVMLWMLRRVVTLLEKLLTYLP